MSKERLEEIKALHDEANEKAPSNAYSDIDRVGDILQELFMEEHTDWLIQQAEEKIQLEERVEELENQLEVTGNELSLVSQENQRSKQALEEIVKEGTLKNFATGNLGYKNGAKIARQALQGGNDNE